MQCSDDRNGDPPHLRRILRRIRGCGTALVILRGWPGSGARRLLAAFEPPTSDKACLERAAARNRRVLHARVLQARRERRRWFVADAWSQDRLGWLESELVAGERALATVAPDRPWREDLDVARRATVIGPRELLLDRSEIEELMRVHRVDAPERLIDLLLRWSEGWLEPLESVTASAGVLVTQSGLTVSALDRHLVGDEALVSFFGERVLGGLSDEAWGLLRELAAAEGESAERVLERALDSGRTNAAAWNELTRERHLITQQGDPDAVARPPRLILAFVRGLSAGGRLVRGFARRPEARLLLLGPPELQTAGVDGVMETVRWPHRRAPQVMALLCADRQAGVTQERLAEVLWPELDRVAARRSIHPTISHLRRLLGGPGRVASAILRSGDVYRLNPRWTVEIDRERLEQLAGARSDSTAERIAQLEEVWRLYRGPFLEGIDEEWLREPRRRLHALYRAALSELAALYVEIERADAAEDCLRTLLLDDPLDEANHVRVMELFASRGRTDLVRRQYEKLSRLLSREVGAQPLDTTIRAVERLLGWGGGRSAGSGRR